MFLRLNRRIPRSMDRSGEPMPIYLHRTNAVWKKASFFWQEKRMAHKSRILTSRPEDRAQDVSWIVSGSERVQNASKDRKPGSVICSPRHDSITDVLPLLETSNLRSEVLGERNLN
jgi:hypothetical protein